jgi:methylthioribulose-1-phosphate dehydratase
MMASGNIAELRHRLIETAGGFYARGWSDGTGGNYSVLASRDPLRVLITASGVDKGRLTPEQILELDDQGQVLSGEGKPSAETGLHRAIYDTVPDAGAVLHTHSPACTVLSERHGRDGVIAITGLEMLKGLRGVTSHDHVEYLPVLENSQDIDGLAVRFAVRLTADPRIHAFLLAGHGLTTWGRDLVEARRHVEILEFLLEVQFRRELLG